MNKCNHCDLQNQEKPNKDENRVGQRDELRLGIQVFYHLLDRRTCIEKHRIAGLDEGSRVFSDDFLVNKLRRHLGLLQRGSFRPVIGHDLAEAALAQHIF